MKVLERSEWIEVGAEELFSFMLDFRSAGRWLALVDRMEAVEPGPIGAGSRIRLHVGVGGRTVIQHTELERFDPPRAYSMRTQEEGYDATFAYQLTPDGSRTRVRFTVGIRPRTLSAWIVFPFAVRGARARLADRLARLKRAAEESAGEARTHGEGDP